MGRAPPSEPVDPRTGVRHHRPRAVAGAPVIVVTGAVVGSDATIDELIRVSLEHVHRSRAEPGCISHAVHRDAENPNRLVFLERWADRDAILAHFAVPESNAFVK